MSAKKELRRTLRAALTGVSRAEVLEQSLRVQQRVQELVASLPTATPAQPLKVGLYLGMTHQPEVDTDGLARWFLGRGDSLYLPRCLPSAEPGTGLPSRPHLAFLPLASLAALEALEPQGKYRLREPTASAEHITQLALRPSPLDVLIVPCVGFNPDTKARIGWGAGYYDEFLSRYHRVHGRVPLLVGVCLEQQLSGSVVGDERDWAMDVVVSGAGGG